MYLGHGAGIFELPGRAGVVTDWTHCGVGHHTSADLAGLAYRMVNLDKILISECDKGLT